LQSQIRKQRDARLLYFYFDYKRQSEQTPLRIVVTLLRQLLSNRSAIPGPAIDLYKRLESHQELPGWHDLRKTFVNLCSDSGSTLVIVFDALDECDEMTHRPLIIELLEDLISSEAKVLITSRSYPPDINHLLRKCTKITVEASSLDIRAFLLDKIAKSARIARIIDPSLREEIVKSLLAKSQGM
jgi:hypothetical protein